MTNWSNCFYNHESFKLITYRISFIFTYLLHSGRHSTLYMNATVCQQLSAPCLWNWSLLILKKHISTWSPCFQYTLSTCQQAFSFSHKIQFIYFPIYLLLDACAHDLRFALSENTTAQASNAAPDFQLFWFMLNRCTYLRFAFLFHSQL